MGGGSVMDAGEPVIVDQVQLESMLEGIPEGTSGHGHDYTPLEDAFIMQVWERNLDRRISAKKLGIAESTMRARHRLLADRE